MYYLVMEYVTGQTIDVWCDERKPSVAEIIGLFRQLCHAVDYAHRRGVLHRDIKQIAHSQISAIGVVEVGVEHRPIVVG